MLYRFDRASPAKLGAVPIAVTPEGYKVYRGVAAFGDVVLEYPEFGRNEFVSAQDALGPEALATLVGVPFTILHPEDLLSSDDPAALKDHVEGTVIKATANMEAGPPELVVDVMVWTAPAQEAIESGRVRDLSPGYGCGDERAPSGAIHNGKPYSVIQRRRQYNHLSGVVTARGVTPDGRRARLDEAALVASYAHDVEEDIVDPEDTIEGAADLVVADPPPDMDPAEALAAFSPEAAEILKTLPPDDLAILAGMALVAKGEAAEESVIAGASEPVVEVEEVDAAAAGSAPAALTADAITSMFDKMRADVASMIADAFGKKMDAQPISTTAAHARTDAAAQAAERKRIEAEVRAEQDFIGAVRRRGGRCDSVAEATSHALAVVKAADPGLLPVAEDAAKRGRRDHLLSLFGAADDRRRRGHLDGQESALFAVTEADDEYHRGRVDAAGGASSSTAPAYLDFGGPVTGPATGAA